MSSEKTLNVNGHHIFYTGAHDHIGGFRADLYMCVECMKSGNRWDFNTFNCDGGPKRK